jgi:uncharacterized protein
MSEKPYVQGEFCWYELGTRDIKTAVQFYTGLMDWQILIHDIGEFGNYYIFQKDGQQVGAGYQMSGPQFEGVPPYWMPFVWVEDVDATASKWTELGGKIIAAPMDIPGNIGRMAFVQDPQGAPLALFLGREHAGAARLAPAPGSFSWTELMTTDAAAARSFYSATLGWTFTEMPMGPDLTYTVFLVNGKPAAGMMEMHGPQFEGVPPHWASYLSVADCDASQQRAVELGAKVLVPAQDIPKVGRFAILQDSTDAVFAIITFLPM